LARDGVIMGKDAAVRLISLLRVIAAAAAAAAAATDRMVTLTMTELHVAQTVEDSNKLTVMSKS